MKKYHLPAILLFFYNVTLVQAKVALLIGNGMQISNTNYLIPVNNHILNGYEYELIDQAINADLVLIAMLEANAKINVVILDACRDNWFSSCGGKRGLVSLAQENTFIAYATQPNKTADDGAFMAAFSKWIIQPLSISQMFEKVRDEVRDATSREQVPSHSNNLSESFYFVDQANNNEKMQAGHETQKKDTQKSIASTKPFEPKMVLIPGGSFIMGSQKSEAERDINEQQHQVSINIFYMSTTEITNQQFTQFLNTVKRRGTKKHPWFLTQLEDNTSHITGTPGNYQVDLGYEQHPVTHVSWYGATAYADWLSRQTGKNYRLPTEAEWEYAARAKYNGNYDYNNCGAKTGVNKRETIPVGSYPPNAFGLYDMVGNVIEWTCSQYQQVYLGQEEKCSSNIKIKAVLRDGSWIVNPNWLRSAHRSFGSRIFRNNSVGFRLTRK